MKRRRVEINQVFNRLRGYDTKRYYVIYGGRRSGKSWAISQLLVKRVLDHVRHVVVLRKYATTVRHSVWPRMLAAVEEVYGIDKVTVRQGDRELRFPNGSVIAFGGLDDAEKWKSAEGVTDYWVEEASEISAHDFDTLDAGLSTHVTPPPSLWVSFNPVPIISQELHWLPSRWFREPPPIGVIVEKGDSVVLRTWYKDNAFCPEPTKRLLEGYEESNPDLWKMWGLGIFTRLRGAILSNWDTVEGVPKGVRFVGYGLDWGYAEDPCALVKVWMLGSEIWAEEKLYASGLDYDEIILGMLEAGVRPGVDRVVPDHAEPRGIEKLRKAGFIVQKSDKGRGQGGLGYKRSGALYLKSFRVHSVRSPNLEKELATWSWKLDKGDPPNPIPIVSDGNDHLIDALLYATYKPSGTLEMGSVSVEGEEERELEKGLLTSKFKALFKRDRVA